VRGVWEVVKWTKVVNEINVEEGVKKGAIQNEVHEIGFFKKGSVRRETNTCPSLPSDTAHRSIEVGICGVSWRTVAFAKSTKGSTDSSSSTRQSVSALSPRRKTGN